MIILLNLQLYTNDDVIKYAAIYNGLLFYIKS